MAVRVGTLVKSGTEQDTVYNRADQGLPWV